MNGQREYLEVKDATSQVDTCGMTETAIVGRDQNCFFINH